MTEVEVRVLEGFCLYFGLRLTRGQGGGGGGLITSVSTTILCFTSHKTNIYIFTLLKKYSGRTNVKNVTLVRVIFIFIKQSPSIILILAS